MAEQYQRFSQLFAGKAKTSDPIGYRVDASGCKRSVMTGSFRPRVCKNRSANGTEPRFSLLDLLKVSLSEAGVFTCPRPNVGLKDRLVELHI